MKALTVTINPALDISTSAENIVPRKKNRCRALMYEAGGGGINVSRAIKKLGAASIAVFVAGGDNGIRIEQLLDEEEIPCKTITTSGNTRENVTVQDRKSGDIYRFIMPGPELKTNEWQQVLETIKKLTPCPEYLIASGSLPPGVPDDFYAQLASYSRKNDIRMVLDTSGPALKLAIEEGVYMCKPNIREMGNIMNEENITGMDLEEAAKKIIMKNKCSVLVVSLGEKGALLVMQEDFLEYITPPVMPVVSTVGAGDSMVGGIITGFSKGLGPEKAVLYGVAAGTAATLTPGSELCRKEDTDKIYNWLSIDNGVI